jgi:glycosyltransferase involved in cell wall biosynthesis
MSKNTFVVSCPIDTYSGYGSRSRDYVKSLIDSGKYNVKVLPQRWGGTPQSFIDDHAEKWGFLKDHIIPNLTEQPDIWCQVTVPNEFTPVGKYNIGLTAGIETTACAPQWIEGCNKMNLILTSSKHSKKVFETTKYQAKNEQTGQTSALELTTPIEVLIEGVDLDLYKPLDVKEITSKELYHKIKEMPETFAYLFVGHWMQGQLGEDRKNVGLLIKAFYELFKDRSTKPALILKTSSGSSSYIDRREIMKRINDIKKSVPSENLPTIYLLHGEFSDIEMNELYNHPKVKAMVSLTKGEGFGRPLLEFSLTGKPVIATGWSGHIDFLKPEFSALMEGELKNIHPSAQIKDMLIEESQWFNVASSEIGKYLSDVYKNYKDWKVKGKRQASYSKSNFSYSRMKDQLVEILDKNIPNLPKKVELTLPKLTFPKLNKIK